MNLPTVAAIIIATFASALLGMAGLIKGMLLGRMDKQDLKLDELGAKFDGKISTVAKDVTDVTGRVIRLEEWRENTNAGTLGRRAMDHCPMPDCPHERRP